MLRGDGAGRRPDLGGYAIDCEIGRGGSATVYRAHHPDAPQRAVALKVLAADRRGPADRARLEREFEFARVLDHRHIIAMYDRGPDWLAMQFIDGGNATRLRAAETALTALVQIAGALDYTHRHGVVHCDVKPANILLARDFATAGAMLIDFGVAHAVVDDVGRRPDRQQVSLPYTAPELLLGQPPSAASDEYALACTAVELLTGEPPFGADGPAQLVDAHLHRLPPPTARGFDPAARAFDMVVERGMAKIPEMRYRSCGELVAHIARALPPQR